MNASVEFWFDPVCPWTWITSRWLDEVASLRELDLRWRTFSLYELNHARDISDDYREHINHGRIGARVAAAVEAVAPDSLSAFYEEFGNIYHVAEGKDPVAAAAGALAACGLDPHLLERAETGEFDVGMRGSTEAGLELVGKDVGVPIISFDGVAFFGPVISPAPHGQGALDLWDGCILLARTPGFFELKRTRDVPPIF